MIITKLDIDCLHCQEQLYPVFREYFLGLFENDETEYNRIKDRVDEIFTNYLDDMRHQDSWIFVGRDNGQIVGFIFTQIDQPHKSWSKRQGWGLIREAYIVPNQRKKGFAKALVVHAEAIMKEEGATRLYLTTDEAFDFWQSMGYTDSGEIEPNNNGKIYIK
ncbi:MAG: GNAT family N-acetyltransferase [Defluviitaleaceae bacterium]|nr:GNAT family N-acetyltransferase [Defluviitaleaceae bacterium]